MRAFLSKGDVVKVAQRFPGVEVVVRRVENRHPHLRGVYSEREMGATSSKPFR